MRAQILLETTARESQSWHRTWVFSYPASAFLFTPHILSNMDVFALIGGFLKSLDMFVYFLQWIYIASF